MMLYLAVLITSTSVIVTVVALEAVWTARADLRDAHLELLELRQRTQHAETEVDVALDRLTELQQLRVDDVQRMRQDVRELREQYERVMHRYRAKHAIEGPLGSRRVQ